MGSEMDMDPVRLDALYARVTAAISETEKRISKKHDTLHYILKEFMDFCDECSEVEPMDDHIMALVVATSIACNLNIGQATSLWEKTTLIAHKKNLDDTLMLMAIENIKKRKSVQSQ